MPIPNAIKNAPALFMGLELYLLGFLDLSSSRQSGMSLGDIPWGAIQEYCDRSGLDDVQTANMHHHINQMDIAWKQYQKSKEKRSDGKPS